MSFFSFLPWLDILAIPLAAELDFALRLWPVIPDVAFDVPETTSVEVEVDVDDDPEEPSGSRTWI